MAVPINSFVHHTAAELSTMLTNAEAELNRLLIGGASFGLPSGRSRTGVEMESLVSVIAALKYAIKLVGGTIVEETIADLDVKPA